MVTLTLTDKEIVDILHTRIHAIRILKDYKAGEMDQVVSKLIVERFKETCKDCREVFYKNLNPSVNQNKSFLNKLGDFMKQ